MYDIEHCVLVGADYPSDFSERISRWLAEGYIILPNSAYFVRDSHYKYIAMVGKPRTSPIKEL